MNLRQVPGRYASTSTLERSPPRLSWLLAGIPPANSRAPLLFLAARAEALVHNGCYYCRQAVNSLGLCGSASIHREHSTSRARRRYLYRLIEFLSLYTYSCFLPPSRDWMRAPYPGSRFAPFVAGQTNAHPIPRGFAQ